MPELASVAAPIVIIGTGLAGYSLAREFRKLDQDTPLLLLTQDDGHAYSKPMLSTAFTKKKSANELSTGDPGKMAEQLNASIRTFCPVTEIDPDNKTLRINSEILTYHKLVLATGAKVRKLALPGADHPRVLSINSLMDFRHFSATLDAIPNKSPVKKIAIIGAGLIGCEYANDLINGGHDVTLIAPSAAPLDRLIPQAAGAALAAALKEAGVSLYLSRTPLAIHDQATHLAVELDSGTSIDVDLVLSAIGIEADTTLARSADIRCNAGICTDKFLHTSAPDVFALGDCAEIDGQLHFYVLPLMASARALAQTLTGKATEVDFGIMPILTKTPVCPIVTCPPPSHCTGTWNTEGSGLNLKLEYSDPQGNLLGFVLTGASIKEKQILCQKLISR